MNRHDTTPHAQNAPASTQIYDALYGRIISFALPPGTRLARSEIADEFGVSASPVREALQQLEREGLVATFRQSRTEVTRLDTRMLRREQFLRTGVECEVCNVLAARIDKTEVRKAAAIVRMQRVLIDEGDQFDLFRRLDDDFHRQLFAAAGHEALHRSLRERTGQMARLRSLDLPSSGKLASVVAGHEAVVEAILASDRHAAADAMRAHLSGTIERLSQMQNAHPAYFTDNPAQA